MVAAAGQESIDGRAWQKFPTTIWPDLAASPVFTAPAALPRLAAAHVGVIGVGGVGSWTVEALARSGVGRLTLIDLDDVCVTNINRQLPALDGTVGRPKIDVLAERVRLINPAAR